MTINVNGKNVIIAALVVACAGSVYYARIEHQHAQEMQSKIENVTKKLNKANNDIAVLNDTVENLKNKNSDLQDRVNNPPVPDVMKEMEESEIRQKTSDYLDKVNRQLDDEYFDSKVEIPDFLK